MDDAGDEKNNDANINEEWSKSYEIKFDLYEDQNQETDATVNNTETKASTEEATKALDIGATSVSSEKGVDTDVYDAANETASKPTEKKADLYLLSPESDEEEEEEEAEEEKARYPCGECLCFLTFLLLFTGMAIFSIGSGDNNYTQTSAFRKPLVEVEKFYGWNTDHNTVSEKHFNDASTIDDIYHYIRQILLPFVLSDAREVNGSIAYYIQQQHILLGGIRLRQIRQKPFECSSSLYNYSMCYDEASIDRDDVLFYNDIGDAISYSYIDSSILLDQRYTGKFDTYPGGGYIEDLPLNMRQSIAMIDRLQEYNWLDAATLFVSLDFNAYSPSNSLHTCARLTFEMPTSGIFTNDEMKTWKFDRYHGEITGFVLFFIHVGFFVFVIIISGFAAVDIYRYYSDAQLRKKGGFWNAYRRMDLLNLFIFYCLIALFIHNETYQKSLIDIYEFRAPFESFRRLQALSLMEAYCFAFGGFLLWFKLFKYLSFHPKFKFLFFMLQRGLQDIIMFILILWVFYLAFAVSGFIIFSSDVAEYRTIAYSIVSMNLFMLTEMNYTSLMESSRSFGSFYYFAWLIWMTFILVNVFIAILIDSYSKTQVEIELNSANAIHFNVFEKGREYVKKLKLAQLMSRFDAIDEDGDNEVDVNEIAKALNLPLDEAQKVINKYDKDGNGVLDRKEFEKLKQIMIREKMQTTPDKEVDDQSLVQQINEMKVLMNEFFKIDPVAKRVLKMKTGN